jgi:TPP-dependent pyruvate/acetoin dehydrogenase alpha subunit
VYRDPEEPATWDPKDPLHRFRAYLQHLGLWSEGAEKEISEHHNQSISEAVEKSLHLRPPPVESLFDDVYEELPWHLREQRDYLLSQPRTKPLHAH